MTSAGTQVAPPQTDVGSEPYWDSLRHHRLQIQACESCARRRFPVTPACPYCAHPGSRWETPEGTGEVYSFVVVHRTFDPAFEADVPYVVATVDLDGGGRMLARMDRAPEIGDRVVADYVDHDAWTELRFATVAP
jgi:uncharacterized protein